MNNVTRRALRVYMALSELKAQSGDVLNALIPFTKPTAVHEHVWAALEYLERTYSFGGIRLSSVAIKPPQVEQAIMAI